MNLSPEIAEIVLDNYRLIIGSLVGYFVVFVLITYAAKRHLTQEVSDYVVASRNLGWLVVTFTMYASILSGVGMAGIPGTVYSVGVPFVITVLTGHTIALALLCYLGPRIWILGKEYNFTTPGDLIEGLGPLKESFIAIPGTVGVFTPSQIFGIFIGLSIGTIVLSPSAWIRIYSASSKTHFVKISVLMLVLWFVSHIMGTYLIGSYGRLVLPDVENPDFVSSLLAFEVMPVFLAALFLIAILAAIISTTDTYMHTLAATVTRDFIQAVIWPEMSQSQEMRLNRVIMGGMAAVGVLLALLNPVLITPLAIFGGGIVVQLLPPLLGAVTWSRASTPAAIVGPAVGIVLTLVWELNILPYPVPAGILPGLATAFFINVGLFVLISYATKPQPPEQVEKFHGLIAREL